MKKKCIAYLLVYLFSSAATFVMLLLFFPLAPANVTPRVPPAPFLQLIAAGTALISAIPFTLAYITIKEGFFLLLRQRSQLAAAGQGELPEDGASGVVFGRLEGRGQPLSAPFSRRPCLAYHYEITHTTSGSRSSTIVDTSGFALSPSVIQTRKGPIDLRAYMEFEFTADILDAADVSKNVQDYLKSAELFQPGMLEFGKSWDYWKQVARDDDGVIRMDRGCAEFLPATQTVKEKIVQAGDSVCVFGRYSAALRAIIPDPQAAEFETARLMKGPLEKMLRTLTIKVLCQVVITAILLTAFGFFLRAFFLDGPDFWT